MQAAKVAINSVLRRVGYQITRVAPEPPCDAWPVLDDEDRETWAAVAPHTMVPPVRVQSLADAVRYVVRAEVPGALVECGVWKGGSALAMARTLARLGETDRGLWLYDTFDEGWPPATERDVTVAGQSAHDCYVEARAAGATDEDLWAQFDRVKALLHSSGYPAGNIHFVKGRVEETIPGDAPESIALLRLDTDWYESTRHELEHLYPRLAPGGVLILDDYGLWKGARQAADEYFERHGIAMFLHRVDDSCRVGVKR